MRSLLNEMLADKVNALLDECRKLGTRDQPFYSREQASAIIHAVLWGHGSRSDSTAAVYAAQSLFDALGLKDWTFSEEESAVLQEYRRKTAETRTS